MMANPYRIRDREQPVPMGKIAALAGGGFNPASLITGNGGFWRSNTGVTQSSGNVSAWADQSSFGNNLAVGGTGNPTYSATSFNSSYPGISFANAAAYDLVVNPFAFHSATFSCFMLLQTNGTGAGSYRYTVIMQSGGDYTGPPAIESDLGGSVGVINFEFYSNQVLTNGGSTFALSNTTNYLLGMTADGAHTQLWINGATQGSTAAFTGTIGDPTAANNFCRVGLSPNANSAGAIYAAVGWTQKTMNSTDWTNLKNWCNSNYGTSF